MPRDAGLSLMQPHLHLTVAQNGIISLWDSEHVAREQAEEEKETYIQLHLTDGQITYLKFAQRLSRDKNGD